MLWGLGEGGSTRGGAVGAPAQQAGELLFAMKGSDALGTCTDQHATDNEFSLMHVLQTVLVR